MTQSTSSQDKRAMHDAIQDALEHALEYGDDRTAFELATILRGTNTPDVHYRAAA